MVRVLMLNDRIYPADPIKYVVWVCCAALLAQNFFLKLRVNQILSFSPSLSIQQSKCSNMDLITDFIVIVGIVVRVVMTSQERDLLPMQIFAGVFVVLLLLNLLILSRFLIYFDRRFQANKKLLMIFLSSSVLIYLIVTLRVPRKTLVKSEFSSISCIVILVTFFNRINQNLSSTRFFSKMYRMKDGKDHDMKEVNSTILMVLFYNICQYVHQVMVLHHGNQKVAFGDETNILEINIRGWLNHHRSHCDKVSCFCQLSLDKLRSQHSCFSAVLKNLKVDEKKHFLLNSVMMLETMIADYLDKPRSYKLKQLYHCYVMLLTYYVGNIAKAMTVVKSLIHNETVKNRGEGYSLENHILACQIDNISIKNLTRTSLTLFLYKDWLPISEGTQIKQAPIKEQVLFLSSLDLMKLHMVRCSGHKLGFLDGIALGKPVHKILEEGWNFTRARHTVNSQVIYLFKKSSGRYWPLLLIGMNFYMDICDDLYSSQKFWIKYKKAARKRFLKLNKIFLRNDELRYYKLGSKDLAVVVAGLGAENRHLIEYCTSNMRDWLCKKIFLIFANFQFFTIFI